jgi:hypothetical protein
MTPLFLIPENLGMIDFDTTVFFWRCGDDVGGGGALGDLFSPQV